MEAQIKFATEANGIKEFVLPNHLKVLLKPSHTIPLITFSIWYKVGSRNERDEIRGIAHFLEHMMFKGTKKFKKGQISSIILEHGGVFNAFTSSDSTAYYETISPKYLEKVIEIESDRMKGSSLDEKELNLEKTVVLSELEGNLNNPATLLDQKIRNIAYDVSSYKHPTIGYEQDIKNTTSSIMREFYRSFYNPSNATIVLVGDFNEQNALSLIEKYFDNIKNEDIKTFDIARDDEQTKEKKITVKRAGSFKILEFVYHITDAENKDIYPLNIIEEILIKGKNSPLNKNLIEKGLATEIVGGAETSKDPGLFYIVIPLTPKATHKQVEKIVTAEINNLIKTPPTEKEINAAKNRIKANYLFGLDGTYNQAINLGYFETINSWKQSLEWPNKISQVTNNEVSQALNKYFQKQNRTIGYFIPILRKGEKYETLPVNLTKTHNYKETKARAESLEPRTVNTTNEPTTYYLPPTTSNLFKYKKHKLKDGSELLVYKNIDLPITYISGVIKGGNSLVPKEKEWECELISRTLEKGSKNFSKEQIEEILDSTGSQIEFSCDEESFKFMAASLNENLTQTIKLLTDLLMQPTFLRSETEKEKKKLIAEIIESKDSTNEIARRRFNQVIYSKEHPYYSNNFDEDIKLIRNIKNTELISIHKKTIKDNNSIIAIVSNISNQDVSSIKNILEEAFNTQERKEGKINIPDTLLRDTPKTESIYVKDKTQSDVFLGHSGNLKRTDADFYKFHVANYILGGSSLASRLSKRVRDNAGLVYHVHSYIMAAYGKGEFGIYFGSNNNNIEKAIPLIKDELQKFVKEGITETELTKAKKSLIDSFVSRNLSTYRDIANTIIGVEFYNLGDDYINQFPQIINSLKLKEINNTIKKYIFPDKLNIVVAGEYKSSNQKE